MTVPLAASVFVYDGIGMVSCAVSPPCRPLARVFRNWTASELVGVFQPSSTRAWYGKFRNIYSWIKNAADQTNKQGSRVWKASQMGDVFPWHNSHFQSQILSVNLESGSIFTSPPLPLPSLSPPLSTYLCNLIAKPKKISIDRCIISISSWVLAAKCHGIERGKSEFKGKLVNII